MARTVDLKCDICKKPTEKIAAKLFYTPMMPGNRSVHSNYSHSCDVGVCCSHKVLKLLNFRPRMTAEEYAAVRRNGTTG